MTSLYVIFVLAPPSIKNPGYAYAWGMAFRAVLPQITGWAPQAKVNFVVAQLANFCPKTGDHKRFFLWNSKTDQVNVIK